jgi:hypothetical protein
LFSLFFFVSRFWKIVEFFTILIKKYRDTAIGGLVLQLPYHILFKDNHHRLESQSEEEESNMKSNQHSKSMLGKRSSSSSSLSLLKDLRDDDILTPTSSISSLSSIHITSSFQLNGITDLSSLPGGVNRILFNRFIKRWSVQWYFLDKIELFKEYRSAYDSFSLSSLLQMTSSINLILSFFPTKETRQMLAKDGLPFINAFVCRYWMNGFHPNYLQFDEKEHLFYLESLIREGNDQKEDKEEKDESK